MAKHVGPQSIPSCCCRTGNFFILLLIGFNDILGYIGKA